MKSKIIVAALAVLLACSAAFTLTHLSDARKLTNEQVSPAEDTEMEEYVYVAVFKDDPMITNHDARGLEKFAEEYGVKVRIAAPETYNLEEQKQILLDVIAEKPDGLMVCGTDLSFTPYVDMAIDAGIPTITVDADLPDSKRLAFVGSDFGDVGIRQAEAMVRLIGGKGIVAMMGINGINMQQAYDGFRSVMENYNDVIVLDEINDESNPALSREITLELLEKYPDLAGIAGFDSNSGPGISQALEEMNMVGKVKVTCVDIASPHIAILKSGAVQKLIGQKRELFTYYGGVLLYQLNHSTVDLTGHDDVNGTVTIPAQVDTGLIEVDSTNVDGI